MSKWKIMFLFLILILLKIGSAKANSMPLLGKVIYIDPGHGGRDPGVVYGKVFEKDINLSISKILEEELSLMGATVFLTREDDIDHSSVYDVKKKRGDLYRRVKMIEENELKTDLYLSIHINWYNDGYWKGAEVLYNEVNYQNKILAEAIMSSFRDKTSTTRNIRTTDLYMYKYINVPGVLIECGFLSNYQERKLLQTEEYQRTISKAITEGVINYFKEI